TFGQRVLSPLHGPEAVAAFEPEAIAVRAEIGKRELGFGPVGARERGDASRTGHGIHKCLFNAGEIAKVRMDPLAFEREGLMFEAAIDAPRAEVRIRWFKEIGRISSLVVGERDLIVEIWAVHHPPTGRPYAALTVHGSALERELARQPDHSRGIRFGCDGLFRGEVQRGAVHDVALI